jgi:uncharacterized protein
MTTLDAIDCLVTPVLWSRGEEPDWMAPLMDAMFGKDPDAVMAERTPEGLIAEMDASGVAVAVLNAIPGKQEVVRRFLAAFPQRFAFSAEFDPRRGMEAVREIRRLAAEDGLAMVRVVPFQFDLAPDHALYYPIYATCVELGLPVSLTTGMPGPPMPAECQRPIHLDAVCRHFPELDLVMQHGADPWWDEAIRLMLKFPRLRMMISDCSPRHLPASLIQLMNTRGRDKVMFATGYPVFDFERSLAEARQLDFRPGVLEAFLHGNAERLLGNAIPTTHGGTDEPTD